MSIYCDSTYRIAREASELDALYALMLKIEKEKYYCPLNHFKTDSKTNNKGFTSMSKSLYLIVP